MGATAPRCRYPWLYLISFGGWVRGESLRRPNKPATPQGLIPSAVEGGRNTIKPKRVRLRGSDAGWSRRRWEKSCRWYSQALEEVFSFALFCIGKRIKCNCDHDNEGKKVHSRQCVEEPAPLEKPIDFSSAKNCEKGCVSRRHKGCFYLLLWH